MSKNNLNFDPNETRARLEELDRIRHMTNVLGAIIIVLLIVLCAMTSVMGQVP